MAKEVRSTKQINLSDRKPERLKQQNWGHRPQELEAINFQPEGLKHVLVVDYLRQIFVSALQAEFIRTAYLSWDDVPSFGVSGFQPEDSRFICSMLQRSLLFIEN